MILQLKLRRHKIRRRKKCEGRRFDIFLCAVQSTEVRLKRQPRYFRKQMICQLISPLVLCVFCVDSTESPKIPPRLVGFPGRRLSRLGPRIQVVFLGGGASAVLVTPPGRGKGRGSLRCGWGTSSWPRRPSCTPPGSSTARSRPRPGRGGGRWRSASSPILPNPHPCPSTLNGSLFLKLCFMVFCVPPLQILFPARIQTHPLGGTAFF